MNTPSKIKNIEEFIQWASEQKGAFMLYRGLAYCKWKVEASAYRRIGETSGSKTSPPAKVFQNSIKTLLDEAKLQDLHETSGKTFSDLQLLAKLQHHGAATCLIDFTENSLVALWFACNDARYQEQDGKVIAMNTDNPNDFSIVSYGDMGKTITEFFQTKRQWKWTPSHFSNRIVAQNSVFVFGKEHIDKSQYEFVLVDKDSKNSILKELKSSFGITGEYLFSDLPGFAQANAHDKIYSKYTAEDYRDFGLAHIQQYEFEKAEEYLSKAIELNSKYADAYHFRGYARHSLENYQGAKEDLTKAIDIDPKSKYTPQYYHGRGISKRLLGDREGALSDFSKAIKLNPRGYVAYTFRGIVKFSMENYQGAMEDFNNAIELNPQYARAYHYRGLVNKDLGHTQEAEEDFRKAKELGYEPDKN